MLHFRRRKGEAILMAATRTIRVNGIDEELPEDPRVTLVDFLRDRLGLSGTKKGCAQGACGACTVLLDGERILSCLALASQYENRTVTTIEGVSDGAGPTALQEAFIENDAFQCGYCTPGQICSAIGMAAEVRRGVPSYVSGDLTSTEADVGHEELRERMSGNLCRCGAYNGIVAAVAETLSGGDL